MKLLKVSQETGATSSSSSPSSAGLTRKRRVPVLHFNASTFALLCDSRPQDGSTTFFFSDASRDGHMDRRPTAIRQHARLLSPGLPRTRPTNARGKGDAGFRSLSTCLRGEESTGRGSIEGQVHRMTRRRVDAKLNVATQWRQKGGSRLVTPRERKNQRPQRQRERERSVN